VALLLGGRFLPILFDEVIGEPALKSPFDPLLRGKDDDRLRGKEVTFGLWSPTLSFDIEEEVGVCARDEDGEGVGPFNFSDEFDGFSFDAAVKT
jgi:hypothetical protein